MKIVGFVVACLVAVSMILFGLFMLAALALPAAAAPPAPPNPTFGQALGICRLIEAGELERAKAAIAAMAEDARPAAMLLCMGYHAAVVDRNSWTINGQGKTI